VLAVKKINKKKVNMYKNTKKGGPQLAPLVGMAIKALAPMVISKIAEKAKEKSGLMMKSKGGTFMSKNCK
jgi:hypothetical protein